MAVLALNPFVKNLLINSPCWKEKLLTISRSATNNFFPELLVHHRSGDAGKRFSTLQYRLFSLARSTQQTRPKIQMKDLFYSAKVSQTLKTTPQRLTVPELSCECTANFCRSFVTTSHSGSQFGVGQADPNKHGQNHTNSFSSEEDWAIRLANENGYLSWCRNTYLATVVAIAMMGEGTTALTQQAAEGAFFVAGLNLCWGTYQFIYNIIHLRARMGMSRLGGMMTIAIASLHMALWFMVCSLYLGYTDDPPDMKGIDEEVEQQHSEV